MLFYIVQNNNLKHTSGTHTHSHHRSSHSRHIINSDARELESANVV